MSKFEDWKDDVRFYVQTMGMWTGIPEGYPLLEAWMQGFPADVVAENIISEHSGWIDRLSWIDPDDWAMDEWESFDDFCIKQDIEDQYSEAIQFGLS